MLDLIGAFASMLSTYFFIRLNPLAWVISFIAIFINTWLYWQKGIYADMLLQGFYALSTCYGFFLWKKPKQTASSLITYLSLFQWSLMIIVGLIMYLVIYYCVSTFTVSTVTALDSLSTTLSLIAQVLTCYKVITSWVLWLVTDLIYTSLYWQKQLPFHVLLVGIYAVFAVSGYLAWHRKAKTQIHYLPKRFLPIKQPNFLA